MKEVTRFMMEEWNMTNMDWMGYFLEKGEHFSYHHLRVAKRHGGPITVQNGAILIQSGGHEYLHTIETRDRDMFLYLTDILIEVNDQRFMPTKEQLLRMSSTLKSFEREHCGDTTSKGHPLIKERYLRRLY